MPEAAKVPVAKREQTKDMTPAEVVDFYSQNEMLGKMPSGEPWAADLIHTGRGTKGKPLVTEASLPRHSLLRFFPQSELARDPNARTVLGSFTVDQDRFMPRYPKDFPGTARMLNELRQQFNDDALASGKNIIRRSPEAIHMTTTDAPKGIGSQGYQMAYDLIRGSGDLNVADALTSRNVLRRPLNVANTYYARGNMRNIMPLSERGTGTASENPISNLFGAPGDPSQQRDDARKYFMALLGRSDLSDADVEVLMKFPPQIAAETALNNPRGMAGYLEMVNAFRAAQQRIPGYGQSLHPADFGALKGVADPVVKGARDRSGFQGALGPGALGRARTTEEAVMGMRMGMTPEEIVERILQGSKDPSKDFAGRYRKGGLAALA